MGTVSGLAKDSSRFDIMLLGNVFDIGLAVVVFEEFRDLPRLPAALFFLAMKCSKPDIMPAESVSYRELLD